MFAGRPAKAVALSLAAVLCGASAFVLAGTAFGGTGPGASGNTITNAVAGPVAVPAGDPRQRPARRRGHPGQLGADARAPRSSSSSAPRPTA